MRPKRDPKRKPPSEQALREALRKDLPKGEPEAPTRSRSPPPGRKVRKKRKRPAPPKEARAPREEPGEEPDDESGGPDEDPQDEPEVLAPPAEGSHADGEDDGPAPDSPNRSDPRVEELEDKVRHLTEALEGMSSEKSELEGVAEKFKGMEDRMKSLLQLSEVLSVRYNPFLSNEEGDVFDGNRHNPANLLPRDKPRAAPPADDRQAEREEPRRNEPSEVLRPRPPLEERFRGEVVRVEEDEPLVASGPEEVKAEQAPEQTAEDDLEAELEEALAPFAGVEEPEQEAEDPVDAGADLAEALESEDEEYDEDGLEADEWDGRDEDEEPGLLAAPAAEPVAEPVTEPAEPAGLEPAEPTPEPPTQQPAAPTPPQAPQAPPQPVAPAHAQPHRPVPPALPARPAAVAQPGPSPSYHPPGRSRESYLALCWFERLAREGDPSEIHLFVDHYAGLGWIPPEHHGWMAYLAESVAPRRPEATWSDVDIPAHDLARLHRRNLRFLDKLFRCGLGADDPLRWDDEAQWWMEDG